MGCLQGFWGYYTVYLTACASLFYLIHSLLLINITYWTCNRDTSVVSVRFIVDKERRNYCDESKTHTSTSYCRCLPWYSYCSPTWERLSSLFEALYLRLTKKVQSETVRDKIDILHNTVIQWDLAEKKGSALCGRSQKIWAATRILLGELRGQHAPSEPLVGWLNNLSDVGLGGGPFLRL